MKIYIDGPVSNERRQRTDLICLCIFLTITVGLSWVGVHAWLRGDFTKLTIPYDPDGKGCGKDYPDYPYIYFASPHHKSLWVTVCVSECPKGGDKSFKCMPNSIVKSCYPHWSNDDAQSVDIYDTYPVAGRLCVPSSKYIYEKVSSALFTETGQHRVQDIKNSWKVILSSLGISIAMGFVFMISMRLCSTFVIWLFLLVSICGLCFLGVFLLTPRNLNSTSHFELKENQTISMVGGIAIFVVALFILLVVCCYRKKIMLGSNIMKAAAAFVLTQTFLFLLPLLLFVTTLIFTAYCIALAAAFYSLGHPVDNIRGAYPFQHYYITTPVKMLIGLLAFYFVWGLFFIIETCSFIVVGSAISWYFQSERPYRESRYRYLCFHMGSVVMGAFLTVLFGLLKEIYDMMMPDTEDRPNSPLSWYRTVLSYCCCLCSSYIFRWFNSSAYTWIHLTSASYCNSAVEITALQIRSPVSTAVVTLLSALFSLLGKATITATTCAICYYIVENVKPFQDTVAQPWVPTIVIGFISFTVGSFFISLYTDSAQAIYLAYLAQSDAGGDRYCPQQLREFLAESKKENYFL